MMNFTAKDNTLMFNGAAIYEAVGEIEIVHDFNDNALILYHTHLLYDTNPDAKRKPLESEDLWETISRNVIMVDAEGKILWRIENFNFENTPDRYLWASHYEDGWIAYTEGGYEKTFDIETGKIISSEYSP